MPYFQRVAERQSLQLFRQHLEEPLKLLRIEYLGRHELPEERAQLVAQFHQPLIREFCNALAGFAQILPVGAIARCLNCEFEILRDGIMPFGKALGFLGAVIGTIDLDRSEMLSGIFQLIGLTQSLGIKAASPGRKGPATNSAADAPVSHVFSQRPCRQNSRPRTNRSGPGLPPPDRRYAYERR